MHTKVVITDYIESLHISFLLFHVCLKKSLLIMKLRKKFSANRARETTYALRSAAFCRKESLNRKTSHYNTKTADARKSRKVSLVFLQQAYQMIPFNCFCIRDQLLGARSNIFFKPCIQQCTKNFQLRKMCIFT